MKEVDAVYKIYRDIVKILKKLGRLIFGHLLA